MVARAGLSSGARGIESESTALGPFACCRDSYPELCCGSGPIPHFAQWQRNSKLLFKTIDAPLPTYLVPFSLYFLSLLPPSVSLSLSVSPTPPFYNFRTRATSCRIESSLSTCYFAGRSRSELQNPHQVGMRYQLRCPVERRDKLLHLNSPGPSPARPRPPTPL